MWEINPGRVKAWLCPSDTTPQGHIGLFPHSHPQPIPLLYPGDRSNPIPPSPPAQPLPHSVRAEGWTGPLKAEH